MTNPRLMAVRWLTQVVKDGVSVNQLMARKDDKLDPKDKGLAKQLLFGSLRFFHQLNTLATNLLNKPLRTKDTDVLMVLISGLYQLKYLTIPDHAAISESVELTRALDKSWASGIVNGVLRTYQREAKSLETQLAKSIQFQFSHPGWMVKRIRQDWPDEAENILAENNRQAPMTIRVNNLKTSKTEYLTKLSLLNVNTAPHPLAQDGLVLENPTDVAQLPGFNDGEVTVQDAAAQLAVELMDLQPGFRVLDGCSAPGGKTTHLIQRQPDIALTAVEMSAKRAEKISQTLERLGMNCQLKIADITHVDDWWDGQQFDRILIDVPCSASGVIRRNPDIKVHRLATDIAPLVSLQQTIMEKCWPLLKPGGRLVYATCSIFKAENEQQVQAFLENHSAKVEVMPEPIARHLSSRASVGYQILPGEYQMDGFYLCALQKS
ncbi:16S rRNA (cytosine(967)-C(5))-methyltransferase RsmB [Aliikangiella marina]|uniref:16S rRNA (cytosine(967)-C(5))-methyltransferase n=1 Tax=Aliikangiella marina TaxID=1712262 RepID=A0A545T1F8_9GAMM|nr:16S rRNA (cytosine(967)-C(5))-methyltransferase RsmB [Aliikangiella marina]TQV71029.1 16S rRNA (cytosine(967)-C(5))-methyltransferase RsmB [Aliikangiella marina]